MTYVARYLRQSMDWVLEQPLADIEEYHSALDRLIKQENGKPEVDPELAGVPYVPGGDSPYGFGDFDGGSGG